MSKSKTNMVDPTAMHRRLRRRHGAAVHAVRQPARARSGMDRGRHRRRLALPQPPVAPVRGAPGRSSRRPARRCPAACRRRATELQRAIHKTIAAVTDELERFHFNKAVARIRELSNRLEAVRCRRPGGAGAAARGARDPGAAARADDAAPRRGAVAAPRPRRRCWPTPPGRRRTRPGWSRIGSRSRCRSTASCAPRSACRAAATARPPRPRALAEPNVRRGIERQAAPAGRSWCPTRSSMWWSEDGAAPPRACCSAPGRALGACSFRPLLWRRAPTIPRARASSRRSRSRASAAGSAIWCATRCWTS